jgi:DNA-binding transcriptional MerR regulator
MWRERKTDDEQVAQLLAVPRRVILRAESAGRIPPADREQGGDDRLYSPEQVAVLRLYFDGRD